MENNLQKMKFISIRARILTNILIIVFTYLIPVIVFKQHQGDYKNINLIQSITFIALFLGSIVLIYINYKNRTQTQKYKWSWIIFQVIGVLGLCYSSVVLLILFLFRNCCGV